MDNSAQLSSVLLKYFTTPQVNLSSGRPTDPAIPRFGWDRVKTSGLHHNIPLLSDHHSIDIYGSNGCNNAIFTIFQFNILPMWYPGKPTYGRAIISSGQAPIRPCHDVHSCE